MPSILLNNARISDSQFECNYLKNDKLFLAFVAAFMDSASNFKHFQKKKMIEIGNVFPKLQTVKILLRSLSKNRHFRKRIDNQHVKVSQILAKPAWEYIFHVF